MKLRFLAKINLINVLSHDALAGKQREQKKKGRRRADCKDETDT